jgi:hypothetical protein
MWAPARRGHAGLNTLTGLDSTSRPIADGISGLMTSRSFGPDTDRTVSLVVALEEAAEAELRAAVLRGG